jgi:hypothetical protein
MLARKLVYEALMLGPVVMLGFLGVGARANRETFTFDAFTDREQATVGAYIGPLKEVDGLPYDFTEPGSQVKARLVASHWIASLRRGELRPLPVSRMEPADDSPVFDQIVRARCRIIEALTRCQHYEFNRGDYAAAARDLMLQIEVSQVAKGTSLQTVYASALRQALLEDRLRGIAPRLTEKSKLEIGRRLARLVGEDSDAIATLGLYQRLWGHEIGTTLTSVLEGKASLGAPSIPVTLAHTRSTREPTLDDAHVYYMAVWAERTHLCGLRTLAAQLGVPTARQLGGHKPHSSDVAFSSPGRQAG